MEEDLMNSSLTSVLSALSALSAMSAISSSEQDSSSCPSLSDPEEEEEKVVKRKRKYKFYDRRIIPTLGQVNSTMFRVMFRVSPGNFQKLRNSKIAHLCGFWLATFEIILAEVEDQLPPGLSTNGKSLSRRERLLVFLFFLAGNSLYWISTYGHWISHGTVVNVIHQCIQALYIRLVPKYVRLPTEAEAKTEAMLFNEMSGFPPIIWSAIGTNNPLIILYFSWMSAILHNKHCCPSWKLDDWDIDGMIKLYYITRIVVQAPMSMDWTLMEWMSLTT